MEAIFTFYQIISVICQATALAVVALEAQSIYLSEKK